MAVIKDSAFSAGFVNNYFTSSHSLYVYHIVCVCISVRLGLGYCAVCILGINCYLDIKTEPHFGLSHDI